MKTLTCPHCGGTYQERCEDFRFDDRICGSLVLPKAVFDKCDTCGDVLFHPGTGDRMHELIEKTTSLLLNSLSVGDFVMARQAAELLGVTVQAFNKNRRIQRGFIHQIDMDGHKLYHRQSVRFFKKTGDGRFPLVTDRGSPVITPVPPECPPGQTGKKKFRPLTPDLVPKD